MIAARLPEPDTRRTMTDARDDGSTHPRHDEPPLDGTFVGFEYRRVLHRSRTRYQQVEILDAVPFGRTLVLDGYVNSAESDEASYHEALIHPAMVRARSRRRVLIIGGAEGGPLREVLRYPDVEQVVMVDIDGELVDICRAHLGDLYGDPWSDPRVELIVGDGRAYIEANTGLDVIVLDLTEPCADGPAQRLFTCEFYQRVRAVLTPGGVCCAQLGPFGETFHGEARHTFGAVFECAQDVVLEVPSFFGAVGFVLGAAQPDVLRPPDDLDGWLAERGVTPQLYDRAMDAHIVDPPRYLLDRQIRSTTIFTDADVPQFGGRPSAPSKKRE